MAPVEGAVSRALVRLRTRHVSGSTERFPPTDVLVAYGVLTTVVLIALSVFIALPVEPFSYWRDLGFTHETAAGAVFTIHGWRDAIDALAWTPWYNAPLFYLNSNVAEALVVLLTWISGNAWLATKLAQVLEVIAAASAAYAMFSTYSRSRFWAFVAGVSYAALPITALAIRGNPAIGLLSVAAPAALAAGTVCMRRYGVRALPFVGLISGAAGYGIALEYAAFSSVPLFALTVAGERQRISRLGWMLYMPVGLLCCLAAGAFYALPSFGAAIYSDAAARTASLVTGSFLGSFSETWAGMLTLVPREAYVSPFPEYNAGPAMPALYAFGALLWVGALAHLVLNRRRPSGWTDYLSMAIVGSCVILALGPEVPLGQYLWNVLFAVPHLNAIRTPDRFMIVPAVFLTFWYTCALERLVRFLPSGGRIAGWTSIVVIIAFISFDASQHCFAVEPTKGMRQPQLDAVQRVVEAEGGKTVSFAGVNGAFSFEDASEYGVPEPVAPAAGDLGWRFLEDGNAATGVLGRMGARTVISAPNWTNADEFPNSSTIFRRSPAATVIFRSPEDVLISRLAARTAVSSTRAICVHGGPGGFDLLDNLAPLRDTAFLERDATCRDSGFVNFDPRDLWREQSPIEAWSGSSLVPVAKQIRDDDYPFVPNRALLNVPWYRNSIDGDRPLFSDSGAVAIEAAQAIVLPSNREWPAGVFLSIRLCSRVGGTIEIDAGSAFVGSLHIVGGPGFRWYQVKTMHRKLSNAVATLYVQPDKAVAPQTWTGVALDGVAILRTPSMPLLSQTRPVFAAFSLDRFERERNLIQSTIVLAPAELDAKAAIPTNMHYDTFETARVWLADAATSQIRFPWMGPSGSYVVAVRVLLTTPGDTVGMDATFGGTCCRISASAGGNFSGILQGRFHLQKGSQIVVRLVSPNFNSESTNRITEVDVRSLGRMLMTSHTSSGSGGTIDFLNPIDASSQLAIARNVQFEPPLASGARGSELTTTALLDGRPKSVSLEILKDGSGSATATLQCDGERDEEPVVGDDTTLALSGRGYGRCSVRINWTGTKLGVRLIRLLAGGSALPGGVADVWMPAGKYRVSAVEADGTAAPALDFHAVGCEGTRPTCAFRVDGVHRVKIGELPAAARFLVFTRTQGAAPLPAIDVAQTASLRWNVSLKHTADIALTQIYDGNWILADGVRTFTGERCDVTNTCFVGVPPGLYRLYHRWPGSLREGIMITFAAFIVAPLLLFLRLGRGRSV